MRSLTALGRTLDLLTRCWQEVETLVRQLITERYTVHDEVFINRLFYGELSVRFRNANEQNEFSRAVLEDLQQLATTSSLLVDARRVAAGIVARVSYHEPQVEAVTGADLGFTVVRPTFAVSESRTGFSSWLHEQGLLCQAKRQTADGNWGSFTKKQRDVLPSHLSYLALLLYGYSDAARRALSPFKWKPCAGKDLDSVEKWLKSGDLAGIMHSREVLDALANGNLGTSDEHIVRNVICAGETAHLKVEITWTQAPPPPRADPPPTGGLQEKLPQQSDAANRRRQLLQRRTQGGHRHMRR